MSRFRQTLSPATVMSAIALFISLGGVGYAAASIGSAQIKNNAVASKDIKNGTIVTKDISKSTARSLKGATGATGARGATGAAGSVGPVGPAGAAGSALAFAHVNAQRDARHCELEECDHQPKRRHRGVLFEGHDRPGPAERRRNARAYLALVPPLIKSVRRAFPPSWLRTVRSAPGSDTLVETTVGTTAGAGANRPFYVVFN